MILKICLELPCHQEGNSLFLVSVLWGGLLPAVKSCAVLLLPDSGVTRFPWTFFEPLGFLFLSNIIYSENMHILSI